MSFFDQVYDKLFSQKESVNKIILHERIDRGEKYKQQYEEWRGTTPHFDFLKAIASSYDLKQQGEIGTPDVHILNTSTSNGFAITYNDSYSAKEFQFLFDWFSEKTLNMGYLLYNSDVTLIEKGNKVETREKHYLKPPKNQNESKIGLQYGNLLIEFIKIDDRPSYLKLIANTYPDRIVKNPENFQNLAEYLFEF